MGKDIDKNLSRRERAESNNERDPNHEVREGKLLEILIKMKLFQYTNDSVCSPIIIFFFFEDFDAITIIFLDFQGPKNGK